ncbi:hypothetical protein BS78_K340200 [Paspalum vaginatum]|uniref:Uncharacterized protein n=1 Tax=Paspalum vaginatum TaxID=158149 RepID=A0A9W7X9T5_9POAL|nr:hypothetical protein BS78_K340200 [Paspalum vaginatum]
MARPRRREDRGLIASSSTRLLHLSMWCSLMEWWSRGDMAMQCSAIDACCELSSLNYFLQDPISDIYGWLGEVLMLLFAGWRHNTTVDVCASGRLECQ